ncbi:uncharacterized protein TRAVEDRAFT_73928 [Trametes versicolor FP-101664 SS1]|uniref:uncharacterized protein n=1 Tax=Trametes versicolor (strain FP-101664) TaxID=717944 RepID=UPI0004622325|nr:uncharacterized protein TRAVEDRAFT_73928 [Trametes versicolor FP-101664 SS1]EIW54830.1 hypothetical protein TRAVEDRAFT_73928 [Trametes versicolor FP-101664 SS1]
MAVFGLGSHDEPIVVSDDEDATHVENELNRWNGSSPSSSSSSPVVREYLHAPYRPIIQAAPAYAPTLPTVHLNQKRKRQEIDSASGSALSHPIADAPGRRTKKKQKARQDASLATQHARVASLKYEQYDRSERHWSTAWSGNDWTYPPGYLPAQHAPGLDSTLDADVPMYRMSDMGRGHPDPLRVPYPPVSYSQQAGPSWHPPDSALGDSLRRLQALSDSLVAKSIGPSMPVSTQTSPPPPNVATPPTDTDKRHIGKFDDKTNAASFDLHSPTLLSPSTPALPPPTLSRTVVVAHLPKKFRHLDFVTSWAERFGVITRLELDPKPGKALVEYESAAHAEAAFASFKLRGGGKEHIRVYWYRGSPASVSTSAARHSYADVEEGELEEGEVLEGVITPAPPKTRSKKKKGKKKAQLLEQRLTDLAPVPPYKLTQVISLRSDAAYAAPPSISPTRPSLEERFTDAPVLDSRGWEGDMEAEMEMDSEDDDLQRFSPLGSPQLLATLISTPFEDADSEDWEADMDVEASSPIREETPPLPLSPPRQTSPSALRPRFLKRPRALSPSSLEEHRPSPAASAAEDRRKGLESAIATSKARPTPWSSVTAPSAISSGTSATSEPVTPFDILENPHAPVAIVVSSEPVVSPAMITAHDAAAPSAAKIDKPAISLEDLAVSFITESIQSAVAPAPLRPPESSLPPKPSTLPSRPLLADPPLLQIPVPRLPVLSHPSAPSATSTPQLSGAAQLLAKKKRLEDHITASKELLGKIAVCKSKAEKATLMRLLKEKQRAMDVEMNGGHAPPSTPGASVAPATPTPAPKATPFRWPQTARELIIDISDSEDEAASAR